MKLIILSPNLHLVFSEKQKIILQSEFDVEYFTHPASLDSLEIL